MFELCKRPEQQRQTDQQKYGTVLLVRSAPSLPLLTVGETQFLDGTWILSKWCKQIIGLLALAMFEFRTHTFGLTTCFGFLKCLQQNNLLLEL